MKLITAIPALSALFFAGAALAQSKPPGQVPDPGVWALMGVGAIALIARYFAKR